MAERHQPGEPAVPVIVIPDDWKRQYPFATRFPEPSTLDVGPLHKIELAAMRFTTDDLISVSPGGQRTYAMPDLSTFPRQLDRKPFLASRDDYFIVQSRTAADQAALRQWLEGKGIPILEYFPHLAYLVRMSEEQLLIVEQRPEVFWAGHYSPAFRVDPLLDFIIQANPASEIEMRMHFDADLEKDIEPLLGRLAAFGLSNAKHARRSRDWSVRAKGNAGRARDVVLMPGCLWIERYIPPRVTNNTARTSQSVVTGRGAVSGPIMDVEDVWARGIRGEGQIASAADTGLSTGNLATLHQDFGQSGSPTNPLRVLAGYALGRAGNWNDDQTTGGGHGTHTSGSIVGNGLRSGSSPDTNTFPSTAYAGTAPKAEFVFQSIMDAGGALGGLPADLNTLFQQTYNDGARVHSNSWGADVNGVYNTDSQEVDQFSWRNKDMLITFSAGNSGDDTTSPGPVDGIINRDSIGAPGTAKNCLTVGATENYLPSFVYEYPSGDCTSSNGIEQKTWGWFNATNFSTAPIFGDLMTDNASGMGAFSSRGPTDDGRFKPDVVAPGIGIISTRTDVNQAYEQWGICAIPVALRPYYITQGGTSMSNPLTAGAATLVRQYYADGWHANNTDVTNATPVLAQGFNPSSALVKATLINGAWDMNPGQYGTGAKREIVPGWDTGMTVPNNVEGYGRVDVEKSLFPGSGWADTSSRKLKVHDVTPGLMTGQSSVYTFDVALEAGANRDPLIVTLVWTDPQAATGAGPKLVNNLDLTVTDPSGTTTYYPNGVDNTSGADTLNNVEQVKVTNPGSGSWTITVSGTSVPGNAESGSNTQPFALVISGQSCTTAPDIPGSVTASASAPNTITVGWAASSGSPVAYRIYRAGPGSSCPAAGYSLIGTVTAPAVSFNDTTVSGGSTYSYRVTAVGSSCESLASSCSSATATGTCMLPPSFAGLTSVSSPGGSSCTLLPSWSSATASCSGAITYNVYRSMSAGFVPAASNRIAMGVSATSYSDVNVSPGTYYYKVRAVENGVEDSNTVEQSGAPAGGSTVTLYTENFDALPAGNMAGFTTSGTGIADWRGVMACAPNQSAANIFRFGANSCTGNYANNAAALAIINGASGLAIPAGSVNTRLNFWHRYDFEAGWDGGAIRIRRAEDAGFTHVPSTAILTGPYNNTKSGQPVWGGSFNTTMTNVVVDLDAACNAISGNTGGCAGKTIFVAFTALSDSIIGKPGWSIDNVVVTYDAACTACTPPGVPTGLTLTTPANNAVHLEWTSGAPAGTSYNIYRETGSCPMSAPALIASGVTGTSHDDTGLAGATTYRYVVRAVAADGCESASSACESATTTSAASVSVTPLTVTVSESGTTMGFNVVLGSVPTGDVVIDVSSGDTGEATVAPSQLTFTNANWSTPQTVTVTGVNDAVDDGDQLTTISVTMNVAATVDPSYDAIDPADVSATTTDNDTASVNVTPLTVTVSESGTTMGFDVVLGTEPTGDVVIDVASGDTGEATVAPSQLTFTSGNWSSAQTVTVTGVNDAIDDGDQVTTISVTMNAGLTADSLYDAINPADVSATTTDNDSASVSVTPLTVTVSESGTSMGFDVVLGSEPAGDVVIDVASGDTGEATVALSQLTFTNANWSSAQTVTVTGVNDAIDDGDQLTTISVTMNAAATADPLYDAIDPADVTATTTDNDTASVSVTPSAVTVTEAGSTSSFDVVLTSEPAGDVVIDVASGDTGEATVAPSQLTFTNANWSSVQTLTVTGVNDAIDDGDQLTTISVTMNAAATADPLYDAIDPADVTATTTDNDTASVSVTPLTVTVTEGGSTSTFDVVLGSEPTGDVVIDVSSGDTGEATVAPTQLTFTSANWSSAQTVTVTGVNDAVDDGDQLTTISVAMNAASTADPVYDAIDPADVAATTTDNDSASVSVTPTTVTVTEAGSAMAFDVVLGSEPTGDVVIDVSSGDTGEATIAQAQLTFTAANWSSVQTVTVTGVDDFIDDGDQLTTVSVTMNAASTADPLYDAIDPADVAATTTDDDTASVSVTPLTISVSESGTTMDFDVVLGSEPTGDVVIDVSSGDTGEATVAPTQLTFTSANWSTAQTVTVTGVNDAIDDGDQLTTISVTMSAASTADPLYDAVDPADVAATTTDNDTAAVNVTPVAVTVTEAGSTSTFDVVLTSEPTGDVVLDVSSGDTGEATVAPSQLTFTSANWSSAQTVTVTGVNDAIDDGDQLTTISVTMNAASTADPLYDAIDPTDVTATTTDNDSASVSVTPVAVTVTEAGSTSTFDVVLTSEPTGDVVVDVSSGDTGEATVAPSQLTFTSANWSSAQTVTVTGVNDAIDDGDQLTTIGVTMNAASTADPLYDAIDPADVTATTTDNDSASVSVTPIAVTVTEAGSTSTFDVVLTSEPTGDVVIDVSSGDTGEATVAPTQLTFTSANWSSAQTVTVTGVNDAIDDGDQLTTISVTMNAASTADPVYDAIDPANVTVTTTDDDTASVSVTPLTVTVTEGGSTMTFDVVLGSEPTGDVVIDVASGDTGEATVAPTQLTFTSANWSSAQTVTVTGVNDAIDDGDQLTTISVTMNAASTADPVYDAIDPADVTATTTDNDTAAVNVTPSAVTVTEAGSTSTFDVVLTSEPTGDVVIDVSSGDTGEATVAPSQLTFTSANWSSAQTVTVTGVNDAIDDGDQLATISVTMNAASTADPVYDVIDPADVAATTTDNDTAAVNVTPVAVTVTEAGSTSTFDVVLTSEPTGDVVIDVSSGDTGEATVATSQLTFTSANWSSAQTVTVTGVNDTIDDGDQLTTISVTMNAASTADPLYDAIDPADVSATTTDNDTAAVNVTPVAVTVTEAGSTSTFDVVLGSEPTGDVVIDVASGDTGEATVAPSQLTFTSANWSSAQTVTVTGVNDAIDDGDQLTTISVTMNAASTADPVYDVIDPADVTATTTDDEDGATQTSLVSSVNPSVVGQNVTFTATVTSGTAGTITGTVTFKDGTSTLGTDTLSGGSASFSTTSLGAGTHTITAEYGGDSTFTASTSNEVSQVVNAFTAPPSFAATATSTSQVALSWGAAGGATSYEIYRTTSIGIAFSFVNSTTNTMYVDAGRAANTTYLYQVRAIGDSGPSPFSPIDAATTTIFTDPILSSVVMVKAVHLTELRTAVNAMRAAAALAPATFTDPSVSSTYIKAVHMAELRTALDAARAAIGLTVPPYTDPALGVGTTIVKAAHWAEVRGGTQ